MGVRQLILMIAIVVGLGAPWLTAARAAAVPDLYAVEVPLAADADDEAREAAYALALSRVLVRVTGQRNIASNPDAAVVLEQAERLVQQFTTRGDSALWVAFDGPTLERAAAQAGLPIWNRDRPSILVWLAVDRGDGARAIIGADSDDPLKAEVEAAAAARGLPLIWPLADSTDLSIASVTDVWGGFGDNVEAASSRYRPDAILVGRLRGRAGQRPYGNWSLQTGGDMQNYRAGVVPGINNVADFLVARLAASASVASTTSITVSNVYSVAAYSETLNYLERLSLIDAVTLVTAQDDTFIFQVELLGDSARLRRAVDVGNVLVSDDPDGFSMSFKYAR